jgi:hypothetical protein
MKQILGIILLAGFTTIMASCAKNVGAIEKTDKAEVLFQQVKNDANFIIFSRIMLTNVDFFKENALKSKDRRRDSAVLRNEKLTLKQKYDSLHFAGYETVNDNNFKLYNLIMYLQKNYPLFGELTSDERSRFVKLSTIHVKKLNNQ